MGGFIIKKNKIIINYNKHNRDIDSKVFLLKIIEKELIEKEFHIINKKSNLMSFSRNQIGKNDVSDKLGAFRRVQYSGKYEIDFKEKKIEIIIQLNFYKQLILILLSLALPLIAFNVINGVEILLTVVVYFLISFFWFYYCINKGVYLANRIISDSLRKFNFN
ncbi:hypothetical protein [Brumimicrobium oceani]|uniref:Uncharacterized protein n=1 Tax=Brumimicrobium oceani TaxID=2100725 RepID=A0A2U2XEM1_9FLAO|nr:hypothetical protein [Brumimicrobium oceani]PWH86235.1 hypothetical protein DIT68_03055 [Brumimicrobium oceani]